MDGLVDHIYMCGSAPEVRNNGQWFQAGKKHRDTAHSVRTDRDGSSRNTTVTLRTSNTSEMSGWDNTSNSNARDGKTAAGGPSSKAESAGGNDYYQILGVKRTASRAEINTGRSADGAPSLIRAAVSLTSGCCFVAAFRKRALAVHPDHNRSKVAAVQRPSYAILYRTQTSSFSSCRRHIRPSVMTENAKSTVSGDR